MPAYLLVEIEIHSPEEYERYKTLTPASLAPFGGRFLARGGKAETIEGEGPPARVVVVEFPSMEKARQWWSSPGYAEAKLIRQRAAKTRMILVEGINPQQS
ncbi:MAG TPA: DUF1330 domain-containing protein [Terriglobales bacterium]|nr:DUF1330 domain-containing protein [Terriglobales bacterium]